mmetsp:Transcript_2643/g.4112  ORF Transcript_2643/g.4112 Transcript_2643/m.4112 type:complete len:542 (-) Transcript_2643:238-1863(-)
MLKCFKSLRALAFVIVCAPFVLFSYCTLYGLTATDATLGTEDNYLTNFFAQPLADPVTKDAFIRKNVVMEQQEALIPSILDSMHQFDKNGPWASSTTIPQWMKDYFIWHREKRRNGLTLSDKSNKYLIVTCLKSENKCGGLSDRLKPVPLYLLMASMTQRILLFHWNTPCALEEYLVPPKGGLDWTIPETLRDLKVLQVRDKSECISTVTMAEEFMDGGTKNSNDNQTSTRRPGLLRKSLENVQVVTAKIQHHDAGHETFNKLHGLDVTHYGKDIFADLYHDVFRLLFEPTPPMALRISNAMDRLGLVPGHYTAAHMRARYPANRGPLGFHRIGQSVKEAVTVDKKGNWPFHKVKKEAIEVATNAINCAYWLNPGAPIYFASDSHDIVKYIVEDSPFANNTMGFPVVGLVTTVEPLHLDTPQNHACSDFYSAFEESWILGQSSCVSVGMGGYGRFGSIQSYNHSCSEQHRNYQGLQQKCPPAVKIQASMDTVLNSTSNATVESSKVVANHEDAMRNNTSNKCLGEGCEIQSILKPVKKMGS